MDENLSQSQLKYKRVESLDILRGFDLFFLILLEYPFRRLADAAHSETVDKFMWLFYHSPWEGFTTWDQVMPLFMFMAGVSIPFSLEKYKSSSDKFKIYRRIFKRFIILWIFGMMCQGHLLDLDYERLQFYSNTLQTIAVGYLFSCLFFLHFSVKNQIIITVSLLMVYWGAMELITVDGFGGGDYTPNGNLGEWMERVVFGIHGGGAQYHNGVLTFSDSYHYSWLLGSLNFIVTVMSGLFAGLLIKKGKDDPLKTTKRLLILGVSCVFLGWLWSFEQPIIKKLWTCSMTLLSSGYSFLLMGIFYYFIDYKQKGKNWKWLKILGMNSITAYMLANVIDFRSIGNSLFFGLEPILGEYYAMLMAICQSTCIFLILLYMYKHKIFLKV